MKIDASILALFAFPILAVFTGVTIFLFLSGPAPYVPERPEFLAYIDQLGISSEGSPHPDSAGTIRNVFSHHDPGEEDASQKPGGITPVLVSVIVENGEKSFCVIDGRKMQVGEHTDTFTLRKIEKDAITIQYESGVEETIHVKVY